MHKQLYQSYREAILKLQLRPGTKLPSTRELARHFGISRNTVMAAFEQLLAEGFLEGKVGSGTFVTNQVHEVMHGATAKRSRQSGGQPTLSAASDRLMANRPPVFLESSGPFRMSLPALDLFPWPTWERLTSAAVHRQTRQQAGYSGPLGERRLREALADYLRVARNVRCEAEQIFIVSGSQQGLVLATKVLLNPGDSAWLEDPGYSGARDVLILNQIEVCPIPVDGQGLMVAQGRERFPNAKLAYVTPSHQYPLGVTLSLPRRLELLSWAASNDTWIVEDDYDSEFRYTGPPLSSLQGLSREDRVIYIGTFSKVLFPSLRLGYVVVPNDLVDRFAAVRGALDIFPPALSQIVTADFLMEGHFARHIRRMRYVYAERRHSLCECVARDLAGVARIEVADSGIHTVLFPLADRDDLALARQAACQGIVAMPLSPCYLGGQSRKGLVLGFGGSSVGEIRSGIARLTQAFDSERALGHQLIKAGT